MKLRFSNWRRLDRAPATDTASASYVEAIRLTRGVPKLEDATGATPVMRRPDQLDAIEREQFVACARVFGAIDDEIAITYDELFTEKLAAVDRTGSFQYDFEAANVEWWDVEDESGRVVYQLLFMGPGYGKLIEAKTTHFIGYVNQYDLWPQTEPNPHADVWSALAVAQEEAKLLFPNSELAELAVPVD